MLHRVRDDPHGEDELKCDCRAASAEKEFRSRGSSGGCVHAVAEIRINAAIALATLASKTVTLLQQARVEMRGLRFSCCQAAQTRL